MRRRGLAARPVPERLLHCRRLTLEAITPFNAGSLLDTVVSLATALVRGGAIGLEQQLRQRTAGLRTNALVAVGAAVFVDMANRLAAQIDVRERMAEILEAAKYPAREIEQADFGPAGAELCATLSATAVESAEFDQLVRRLESLPGVTRGFWEAGSGSDE